MVYGMNAGAISVLNVLDEHLKVPEYQRNYSWKRRQWEEFWQDLTDFYEERRRSDKDAFYFLGTIVVTTSGRENRVLDGQQRLATTLILIRALVTAVNAVDPVAAERIRGHCFGSYPARQRQGHEAPLQLSAYDGDFFEKRIVLDEPQAKPSIHSHKLIDRALSFFSTEVGRMHDRFDETGFVEWVEDFAWAVLNRVKLIRVQLEEEESAGQLFESLNDRGIGLSTLDLFRNFVLQHTPNERDRKEVQDNWSRLLDLQYGGRPEELLRFYWITREGDVKARSLFRDIKRKVGADPHGPYNVAVDLFAGFVDDYEALLAADHKDANVRRWLEAASDLKAKPLYPLLLSARCWDISAANFERILRTVVSYYVRHTVIGDRESTHLEAVVYSLAQRLRADGDVQSVVRELSERGLREIPDTRFQADFAGAEASGPTAKYLLRELESELSKDTREKVIARDVTLEHIYPQSPPPGSVLADHDDLIDRLGNLTLLTGRWNSKLSNRPFADKRKQYGKSQLRITSDLNASSAWGRAEIEERQRAFAKLAPRIWRLS